jgi:hypothetical protein
MSSDADPVGEQMPVESTHAVVVRSGGTGRLAFRVGFDHNLVLKMKEINDTIADLWTKTYQGTGQ